jgi:hypothetical protein
MLNSYRKLPRWAQWTIPVVLVLAVVAAASSSSSKKGSESAATSSARTATQQAKTASTGKTTTPVRVKTTKLGWPAGKPEQTLTTKGQVLAAGEAVCRSLVTQIKPSIARLTKLKEEAQAPVEVEAPPLLNKAGKNMETASLNLQNLPVATREKSTVNWQLVERLAEAIGATGSFYIGEAAAIQARDAETAKKEEHEIQRTAAMADHFGREYGLKTRGTF